MQYVIILEGAINSCKVDVGSNIDILALYYSHPSWDSKEAQEKSLLIVMERENKI
jgi:hypothetical protein